TLSSLRASTPTKTSLDCCSTEEVTMVVDLGSGTAAAGKSLVSLPFATPVFGACSSTGSRSGVSGSENFAASGFSGTSKRDSLPLGSGSHEGRVAVALGPADLAGASPAAAFVLRSFGFALASLELFEASEGAVGVAVSAMATGVLGSDCFDALFGACEPLKSRTSARTKTSAAAQNTATTSILLFTIHPQ